jgi:hypothetical protein
MHVGIYGPTRCGKTTLAHGLAGQYACAGRANLVCDPIVDAAGNPVRWPAASWQTTDPLQLLEKAKRSRGCILWLEESSITIARDRSLSWFFTTAGNPHAGGHVTHVIGQDGSSLLPGMRQQLSRVYLFRCHPKLAEIWAEQFCNPEIIDVAPKLERFEFIIIGAFMPIRRCRLALPRGV